MSRSNRSLPPNSRLNPAYHQTNPVTTTLWWILTSFQLVTWCWSRCNAGCMLCRELSHCMHCLTLGPPLSCGQPICLMHSEKLISSSTILKLHWTLRVIARSAATKQSLAQTWLKRNNCMSQATRITPKFHYVRISSRQGGLIAISRHLRLLRYARNDAVFVFQVCILCETVQPISNAI